MIVVMPGGAPPECPICRIRGCSVYPAVRARHAAAVAELRRCEEEISTMRAQGHDAPAWLVTLGIEDWEAEKRLVLLDALEGERGPV